MNYIFQFLIISLIILFQFYSIGLYIVSKFKLKLLITEKFLLSLILGIAINVSLLFWLGMISSVKAHLISYVLLILGILNFKQCYANIKEILVIIKNNYLYLGIIIVLAIVYSSTIFRSGLLINGNYIFQEFADSSWHIALINRLTENIPPSHPSSYLYTLTNYHYFYDLLLATIVKNYAINVFFLYFQYFMVFISLLLGLSAFIFFNKIVVKKIALIGVIAVYFAGSFANLIPLFLPGHSWSESSFWVSQTFATLVNPQLIFSFSILFLILILLLKDKNVLIYHLIISFLIAVSMGFKSYSFLVLSCLYLSYLFWDVLLNKNLKNIFYPIILLAISIPYYLFLSSHGKSPFFWKPFWYLDTMVEASDRLNLVEWKMREDTFWWLGNAKRAIWIKVKEFFIFYLGNLGIRFLFLPFIIVLIKINKKLILSILMTLVVFSIFPLFFLQTGTVWNSIQFWYYVLILADVLFVLTLDYLNKRIKSKLLKIIGLILLFSITIPVYLNFYQNKNKGKLQISENMIVFLKTIPQNSRVLICPEADKIYNSPLLPAFINSQNYLSNPGQLSLINLDPEIDEQKLIKILDSNDSARINNLINENGIEYVICKKDNWVSNFKNIGISNQIGVGGYYLFKN